MLKQIDQHVFFDCSPPTRLAILRAMRLNMLVSGNVPLSDLSVAKPGTESSRLETFRFNGTRILSSTARIDLLRVCKTFGLILY
jgi:hypothetical protein